MKKNIIYITGNDSYGIELEVKRWTQAFQWKFGDINIDRYDLSDGTNLKSINEVLLMSGLFVEKRLFIFRWGRDKKSKSPWLEELLENKLSDIPDEHFLLFHNISPKEDALIKWLTKNADVRNINTIWDASAWESRFDIKNNTLTTILRIYREAEWTREKWDINSLLGHSIAHTIQMASILENDFDALSVVDIESLCHSYGWDTMFALVDSIMSCNIRLGLDILHRINSNTRVDEWIGSLIWLLRNNLYIKYFKEIGLKENEIASIIDIHPFVLKKGYNSRIGYIALKEFMRKITTTSIAYKRGKWMKDSELWRILSIELALLDLQKTRN